MFGFRFKITFTFSDAVTMTLISISVLGITERELPMEPIVLIKSKGLCVVGRGVNVGA